MSVVGIDFGNLNTVVAVARNRGIDVICNEVSNRATPSLVSFGDNQRFLGEAAKTMEISNFKNTVGNLKRLMGRPFGDADVQAEAKYSNFSLCPGEGDQVSAKVMFQGEESTFTLTQIAAMFLGRVKEFTGVELKSPMTDAVISCPAWFTDRQRRAILDAAEVVGINCLRVMDDTTATALGYGITKTDLPDPSDKKEKARIVVFVDFGHSSFQVSVVSFVKGKLVVKSTAFDRNLGGRDFDDVLAQHYIDTFDKTYKMDIRSSPKAVFRLRAGCEKVKKILSANPITMLNVECLLDDKDVSAQVHRADFEEWAKPLLDRVMPPIEEALALAGVTAADVDFVELVGGSTRIHSVKETIAKFFGPEKISTTMNQDEAVARGCALQCAIVSPVFKVRDFVIQSWNGYPIELTWDAAQVPAPKANAVPDTRMDAFPLANAVPSSKVLTFFRKYDEAQLAANNGTLSFTLEARYAAAATDRKFPVGCGFHIGSWTLSGIKRFQELKNQDKATIKVRVRLDANGIMAVESAHQVEEVIVPVEDSNKKDSKKDDKKDASSKKDDSKGNSKDSVVEEVEEKGILSADGKSKRVSKKHDLSITAVTSATPKDVLLAWITKEGEVNANDRLIMDTAEKRNSLEEYVYDTRSKLEMAWSDFITDSDRTAFMALLNATEDWLYGEEGEAATKSVYADKLAVLHKLGDPVAARYLEAEERPRAERLFREAVNAFLIAAQAGDDRYAHIPAEDLKRVKDACTTKMAWLNDGIAKQNEQDKAVNPVITVAQMTKEKEALAALANPILSRPKPKPVVVAAAPAEKEDMETSDETIANEDTPKPSTDKEDLVDGTAPVEAADKGMELD